jgi:hypothetical protein
MWKQLMAKTRILMMMLYKNTKTKLQLLLKEMMEKTRILVTSWFVLLSNFVHKFFKFISTGASTTTTLKSHGKIKWIGAALGFTHQ